MHGLSEAETEEFVAGFVGEATASEWFAFIKEQDLPDPAALLDGAVTYAHNPLRLDRTVAVLAACAALVLPPKAARRAERSRALWALIGDMSAGKADLDLFVPVCQALVGAGLVNLVDAGPVLAALQPILKAAGIKGGR